MSEQGQRWTVYACSICGPHTNSSRNWCGAGCGRDYNEMEPLEVVRAEVLEERDRLREALERIVAVDDPDDERDFEDVFAQVVGIARAALTPPEAPHAE